MRENSPQRLSAQRTTDGISTVPGYGVSVRDEPIGDTQTSRFIKWREIMLLRNVLPQVIQLEVNTSGNVVSIIVANMLLNHDKR